MVALPPKLQEQKRIAAKFESLCGETQHLESIYQQKLAALGAKVFAGFRKYLYQQQAVAWHV